MTITSCLSAAGRRAAAAIILGALAGLSVAAARAAEPPFPAGASDGDMGATQTGGRRLDLSIGRSVVIELNQDAKEIFVANPAVANAVVRSTRKLFLLGVANGSTSVFVMDAAGRQIASLEVNVGRDLNILRQTIRATVPKGRIDIRPAGDSILLTGTVSSAADAQQAVDIAKAFVGQNGASGASGGAPGFTGNVINALTIMGRDQVMLRVAVVEVARSAIKQLGVNIGGDWNIINAAGQFANPGSGFVAAGRGILGSLSGAGASIQGQTQIGNASVGGTLTALESAGLSRTLAEPTLVAVSGESATFLAGGEIPIAISSCGAATGGGSGICTPTITYKQYGVSLAFTPVVLTEGRISLHVSTEVSEIDRENADPVTKTPGFKTRKTQTTVELPSGGTMMSAGLISSQAAQTISGVPGLINLPVLGALFRSRDFQRRDTELMIMVTPYIAKPMEAAQVKRPDDGFVDATDAQTILLGRLNKIYGVAGPGGRPAAPAGRFGFITD